MTLAKRKMMALAWLCLAALASSALLGCNPVRTMLCKWRTPEAHVPPGAVAEVRRPVTVPVWIHDKKTGEAKKAYATVGQGWLVGPPAAAQKESAVK